MISHCQTYEEKSVSMCTAVRRYRGQMLRSHFLSQWGFPLGGKMSLVRDEA